MSLIDMWPDDLDGSSSTASLRGASVEGPSSLSEGLWSQPNNSALSTTSHSRPTDMDLDHYPLNAPHGTAPQSHFYADAASDDDFDDWFADEPQLDILAVTDVLTQGMDFDSPATIASTHAQPANISVDLPTALGSYAGLVTSPMSPPLSPILPSSAMFAGPSALPAPPQAAVTNGSHQSNAETAPPTWMNEPWAVNPHAPFTHQAAHHPALHPNAMSFNPNAAPLGPENHNLPDFLRYWAYQSNSAWHGMNCRERGRYPWLTRIGAQMARNIAHVGYDDLEGDRYDVQGIDWEDLGITRNEARERRLNTYKNYVNIADSDRWQVSTDGGFRDDGRRHAEDERTC